MNSPTAPAGRSVPTGPAFGTGDDAFDGQLQRSLTAAMRGCADLGEIRVVASRIQAGDFASWGSEWRALADAARAEGDESMDHGSAVSARRCYLRAAEYYRQACFFARDDLTRPDLLSDYHAHVSAFRAAVPLLPHEVTPMKFERGDVAVSGYLLRPAGETVARPTMLLPAGYDSTAEAGYADSAFSALDHGMNALVFEGPGQGGVLIDRGQVMRPDFEVVLHPVVDWVLEQHGVDPAALVLLGRSFAGYLAPRGATAEPRLAALVCDPAQYDFGAALHARLGDAAWQRLQAHDPDLEGDLGFLLADPQRGKDFACRMAVHGATSLTDYFRALSQFSLVGLADRIACPTLALEGEGDFAGNGQLDIFARSVGGPVTTRRFTAAEGAGGHCEGLGQQRYERVVYDWLGAVLGTRCP